MDNTSSLIILAWNALFAQLQEKLKCKNSPALAAI